MDKTRYPNKYAENLRLRFQITVWIKLFEFLTYSLECDFVPHANF